VRILARTVPLTQSLIQIKPLQVASRNLDLYLAVSQQEGNSDGIHRHKGA
jgi:hypothetical protein